MKVEFIQDVSGNYLFSVDGAKIQLWISFGRTLISLDDFSERCVIEKAHFSDPESAAAFIHAHEGFISDYITVATRMKAYKDSFNNFPDKKLVGIIHDHQIIITTISLKGAYVSVTADIVIPTPEKVLIAQGKESWMEEYMMEENKSEKEARELIEDRLRYEGVSSLADISLFPYSFTYRKAEWYFESNACGCLHKEILRVHPELKELVALHLKEGPESMTAAVWHYHQVPTIEDINDRVLELGRKLVGSRKVKA